ncbi:MAG: AzlD domain-containing protein [Neisseria sp.]
MEQQLMQWVLAVFLMGAITFSLRAAPLLLPKSWLRSHLLVNLNAALPLCVLILLILANLSLDQEVATIKGMTVVAECLALLVVLMLYIRWRNVFVCMVAGVGLLNGLLILFSVA